MHMPLPVRFYDPQLAVAAREPPTGAEWVHEASYPGHRVAAMISSGRVQLVTLDHMDCTLLFASVADAVRQLRCDSALLDGQLVLSEESDIQRVPPLSLASGERLKFTYLVFDLLELEGIDLRKLPLEERKAELETLVGADARVAKCLPHFEGHWSQVLEHASHPGCDAIVSKRRGDRYLPGPTGSWVRSPLLATQRKAASE